MTIDCINLYDNLPCDLKRVINGMCHHEIYYLETCSNMYWDDLNEKIYTIIDYNEENSEMLLNMLEHDPYISKLHSEHEFSMQKWFYYDYIKHYNIINGVPRYCGKEWYWDDSSTDYAGLTNTIVDYLQHFDNFYHNNQSNGETINLESINAIYHFIFQEYENKIQEQTENDNKDQNDDE